MKALKYILALAGSLLPSVVLAHPGHGVEVTDSFNLLHYVSSHGAGVAGLALIVSGSYALYRVYREMKNWRD
ncbi:hypothetical protein COV82_03205 [Candidatus Peregrinibacteria bacterium CG11_big_fil_rev_8_21_14_0_20_46_8]|nr:MAG: hypothetical protein COV82_03205 [Candidatus Peregrinibacteria bacterium CG11_big_fil_rev_8_21_14_0_20_46_8]